MIYILHKDYWDDSAKARSKKRLDYFKETAKAKREGKFKRLNTVGWIGERICQTWLTSAERKDLTTYDYKWAGLKVETKASSNYGKYWLFTMTKAQLQRADYFFLVALGERDNPKTQVHRIYFVPQRAVSATTIRVSQLKDKYSQFRVK